MGQVSWLSNKKILYFLLLYETAALLRVLQTKASPSVRDQNLYTCLSCLIIFFKTSNHDIFVAKPLSDYVSINALNDSAW